MRRILDIQSGGGGAPDIGSASNCMTDLQDEFDDGSPDPIVPVTVTASHT